MFELYSQGFTLLGLGFVLGLPHALDADHIVAVSTQVSETKSLKSSSFLGMMWGMGHTTTLLMTGIVVLVFKWSIPDSLALSMEFLVGVLLVVLGVDVLRKILKNKIHVHLHKHEDGKVHSHVHAHKNQTAHNHSHKSFFIGMVHGLAGSAALGLLVLASVETVIEGVLFILCFGIGSILGMMVTTAAIALPFKFFENLNALNKMIHGFVGVASIVLGVAII